MPRKYAAFALEVPVSYHLSRVADSGDLVVLLHGFRESALVMARRALGDESLPCNVLVPNGPFPTPLRQPTQNATLGFQFPTSGAGGVVSLVGYLAP